MYLDTDVVLGLLKVEDWLGPATRHADLDDPKTSILTAVEVQLVMFDEWSRSALAGVATSIEDEGIELLPLTRVAFAAGSDLLPIYPALNVFDAIHVGHAVALSEPIVSTDTLYPEIEEVDHLDPRAL